MDTGQNSQTWCHVCLVYHINHARVILRLFFNLVDRRENKHSHVSNQCLICMHNNAVYVSLTDHHCAVCRTVRGNMLSGSFSTGAPEIFEGSPLIELDISENKFNGSLPLGFEGFPELLSLYALSI